MDQSLDWQSVARAYAKSTAVRHVRDREPVGRLHIAVATKGCQQGGMGAIEVRFVARAPGQPDHASLPFVRHALLFCQGGANDEGLISQPSCAWKATLAFRRVFGILAMFQR